MKKTLTMMVAALAIGSVACAQSFNPFRDLYKVQAHKEMQRGVAQYNYMVIDENADPIPNVVLTYVNYDNKVLNAHGDGKGKVHMEFRQPNFIQLVGMTVGGVEYRVIGDDVSDDVDAKDIAKGDVSYNVIQRHSANKAAYIYDAD